MKIKRLNAISKITILISKSTTLYSSKLEYDENDKNTRIF